MEALKANELRIGNYIRLGDVIGTPTVIDADGEIAFEGIEGRSHCDGCYDLNRVISPIPLSPEWMERLGFVQRHKPYNFEKVSDNLDNIFRIFMQVFESDTYFTYPDGASYLPKIYYVHQLQNLYHALTGSELTIKEHESMGRGC